MKVLILNCLNFNLLVTVVSKYTIYCCNIIDYKIPTKNILIKH